MTFSQRLINRQKYHAWQQLIGRGENKELFPVSSQMRGALRRVFKSILPGTPEIKPFKNHGRQAGQVTLDLLLFESGHMRYNNSDNYRKDFKREINHTIPNVIKRGVLIMCGKLGVNEVESMQNMMSMAVYFVIADTFDLDVDEVYPDSDLKIDLGMTSPIQKQLDASIMDMFNDLHIDFSEVKTVQDVVDQVAKVQIH
ncbi:acyl carrier protein [Methylomonas rivi]|uniref:Acyl carrier protein n=1 Tax=Methylomonas rivi TaxID=2952226 RepID=A0ABT1U2V2_9GAMM|nr:acyl carrier protein [Methylomonas sp. WSC-6]MCQ8128167.1 acyl carrier protein [Methylomonas sp. WSC-6]